MSRNGFVLERTASEAPLFAPAPPAREVPPSGEYLELIRRHFQAHSAIAIVAVGSGQAAAGVCDGIAAELAAAGNRVVIVSVDALLRMNPVAPPGESGFTPARSPNVWRWPSADGGQLEFFNSHAPAGPAATWLDSLRLAFDSVLLDCPAAETAPAAAQLAAMADAAMLVVETGRTTRRQILHDQRSLWLRGVKLAGCILMQQR